MYHRRFDYMRYAKGLAPRLSLAASGGPARPLGPLARAADFDDAAAPARFAAAVAARYSVSIARVLPVVGASEANAVVALAYVRPGDEVVVERPAYEGLPGLCAWLGAEVRRVDRRAEDGYRLDLAALAAAMTPRTRLVMLTHPHNPSGAPLTAPDLVALEALAAERGVPILVDEIYRDHLPTPPPVAAAAASGTLLITTSSLTKVYGLSALRCGWIIAPPGIARRLDELIDWLHVVPPLPSLALALAAWPRLDGWRAEEARRIAAARGALEVFRARTGLLGGPVTDGLPFYLATLPDADDRAFCARLADRGLALPAGSFFEAPGRARLGFGHLAPAALEAALAVIATEAGR